MAFGHQMTGTKIVAKLAAGREWWRLRAGDVQPWICTLPPSATQDLISRTECVGTPWDGVSTITLGTVEITGVEVARLLDGLCRGIAGFANRSVVRPDHSSIRQCLGGPGRQQVLVVDIDFGGFILPLCIEEREFRRRDPFCFDRATIQMLDMIRVAGKAGSKLARRESNMRQALEQTAGRMGKGVSPLWLRMEPVPHYLDTDRLLHCEYVMIMVMLDERLEWAPVGAEVRKGVSEIRSYFGRGKRDQSRRSKVCAKLEELGSSGFVSDVALALIRNYDHDAEQVLQQAKAAREADLGGIVNLLQGTRRESLVWEEGVLRAMIDFGTGVGLYSHGSATLLGEFPDTFATAAQGRRLAEIVDHPAFRASRVRIKRAVMSEGVLDLQLAVRTFPVEAVRHGLKGTAETSLAA